MTAAAQITFTWNSIRECIVELQWLEHLRDHGKMFGTGVVRASEI